MTEEGGRRLLAELFEAVASAVDAPKLEAELRRRLSLEEAPPSVDEPEAEAGSTRPTDDGTQQTPATADSAVARTVLRRLVLEDILDESILAARPEDESFPLRVLFGTIGERIEEEIAFTLASGMSLYFRVEMEEEAKVRLGLEVSRLYYRFATEQMEHDSVPAISPLLAKLMSTELTRLRFDAVDHMTVFDSAVHERADDSDETASELSSPASFLCRVESNEMVRFKALVRTG